MRTMVTYSNGTRSTTLVVASLVLVVGDIPMVSAP
jgi:hypothetical protein